MGKKDGLHPISHPKAFRWSETREASTAGTLTLEILSLKYFFGHIPRALKCMTGCCFDLIVPEVHDTTSQIKTVCGLARTAYFKRQQGGSDGQIPR